MKKWVGGVFVGSLVMILVLKDGVMKTPFENISMLPSSVKFNSSNPLNSIRSESPPSFLNHESANRATSADTFVSSLFVDRNFTPEARDSFLTWDHMKRLVNNSQGLPNSLEAIREAQVAWESLMDNVESSVHKVKELQCPYFLNKMNATELGENGYSLRIPCGLIQGSAITVIGIPKGVLGSFRIDFTAELVPGVPDPPIVLHYNVRLLGDKLIDDPVIVQNTWTVAHGWGDEERCPLAVPGNNTKVDEMNQCNEIVGKDETEKFTGSRFSNASIWSSMARNRSRPGRYFPFKQGCLSVMTLRVGEEGIQTTVDGKHVTSFAFRESLEPRLVSEIRISGDMELASVFASGLPASEESERVVDLEALRSVQLQLRQPLDLFIGVFSTANNFKRRMAVRRTWMQYPAVREGAVAVRFFVGLHKNEMVNEELWTELQMYGDIQLMPFVDYYNLITWKTLAICIFGAEIVSAKYIMKTDDDAFVRVDEVLASLSRTNVQRGLLFGLINSDAQPHRNVNSKWYISFEEWPESTYPPWAHGPGYVVSRDIAKAVYKMYEKGNLKMFKLEDVAMGMWIADMKERGLQVSYVNEARVYSDGCKDGYVIAHYQSPREMLCLWWKLREGNKPECCSGQ